MNSNPVNTLNAYAENDPRHIFHVINSIGRSHGFPDNDAIQDAMLRDPDSAKITYHFENYGEMYPLCAAVRSKASLDSIETVYDSFPDAIQEKNQRGCTLLHTACQMGLPFNVVKFLWEKNPAAIRRKNLDGHTPLFVSCRWYHSLHIISFLWDKNQNATHEKANDGNTPLHVACRYRAPLDVIQFLLDKNPAAIWEKNHWESTPFFFACQEGVSLNVIKFLWDKDPKAIHQTDHEGSTPLHRACYNLASLDVVKFLWDKNPNATHHRDVEGSTPLHLACNYRAPTGVIQFLLDKDCDVMQMTDEDGCTPLHNACDCIDGTVDHLRILATMAPETILTKVDKNGDTPFHYFCEKVACLDFKNRYYYLDIVLGQMCLLLHMIHTEHILTQEEMTNSALLSTVYAAAAMSSPDLPPSSHCLTEALDFMISTITHAQIEHHDLTSTEFLLKVAIVHGVTWEKGLKSILRVYPEASLKKQIRHHNIFTVAIECGVVWDGLQVLLKACPDAITVQDGRSGLYPFMTASVTTSQTLDVIYLLLRFSPDIITIGIIEV